MIFLHKETQFLDSAENAREGLAPEKDSSAPVPVLANIPVISAVFLLDVARKRCLESEDNLTDKGMLALIHSFVSYGHPVDLTAAILKWRVPDTDGHLFLIKLLLVSV